jgi:hypothetical protein
MKKIGRFIVLSIFMMSVIFMTGCSNNTPYIGKNGNWWVGESDTGVPAQGEKGDKGDTGDSVTVVSVEKTGTEANIDTYTITFSDGSTSTFTVTNGADGESVN